MDDEGGGRPPGLFRLPGGGTENARDGGGAHDCWFTGGVAKSGLAPALGGAPGYRLGCCWNTDDCGALMGVPKPR